MSSVDQCANCGARIGKLETPYVWKDQAVCGTCYAKLAGSDLAPVAQRTLATGPLSHSTRWLIALLLVPISLVCIGIIAVVSSGAISSLIAKKHAAEDIHCMSNLRQIAIGIQSYRDGTGRFPDDLSAVAPQYLTCPTSGKAYVYLGRGMQDKMRDDRVIAYEPTSAHTGTDGQAESNFLFADGHVELMRSGDAEQAIRRLSTGSNPP